MELMNSNAFIWFSSILFFFRYSLYIFFGYLFPTSSHKSRCGTILLHIYINIYCFLVMFVYLNNLHVTIENILRNMVHVREREKNRKNKIIIIHMKRKRSQNDSREYEKENGLVSEHIIWFYASDRYIQLLSETIFSSFFHIIFDIASFLTRKNRM